MFPARRLFPPVFHRLPHHAACGPKGPLYLPGRMPWQVSASGMTPTDERATRSDFCKKQAKPAVFGQVELTWAPLRARSGSAALCQPGPAAASCAKLGEGGSFGFLGHWGIALAHAGYAGYQALT
jgi:predicted small lipoprotein YifL